MWYGTLVSLIEILEKSQRRASKLVRNIKHKSYEERLSNLNLMLTLDRRDRGDMIMTCNIINHRVEMDTRFMKMNTESRTRGHTMKLKISRSKIEIRRNFFTNRITKRGNGLSQQITNSKAIDAFKRAYYQEKGLIRNVKHKIYEERLSTLNLMLTLDRRDRGDMIMAYIIIHRVEMDARFMKMNTESRTRGHTMKLKIS